MCCEGGGGPTRKHGSVKVGFQWMFEEEMSRTVVPWTHTLVMYVLNGVEGGGLVNMGRLKLIPVAVFRGIDTHGGFVSPYSSSLCFKGGRGRGEPGKHWTFKVVLKDLL